MFWLIFISLYSFKFIPKTCNYVRTSLERKVKKVVKSNLTRYQLGNCNIKVLKFWVSCGRSYKSERGMFDNRFICFSDSLLLAEIHVYVMRNLSQSISRRKLSNYAWVLLVTILNSSCLETLVCFSTFSW